MADSKRGSLKSKGKVELPYNKKAYLVQGLGVILGVLGLVLTGLGDITFSVIFMVLGFVILLPIGLWMKG